VAKEFGLTDGHEVMDAKVFSRDPRPFFKVAKQLYPAQQRPSATHHFIRRLELGGRLLRLYTQNIDTLERKAGIEKLVYCHGSFATATCTRCSHQVDGAELQNDIHNGEVPLCHQPRSHDAPPAPDTQGARSREEEEEEEGSEDSTMSYSASSACEPSSSSASSEDEQLSLEQQQEGDDEDEETDEDTARPKEEREEEWRMAGMGKWDGGHSSPGLCGGVIKPDIVMFQQQLPDIFERTLTHDIDRADLLLVMGTSLSVAPVAHMPSMLQHIPSIIINAEPVMPDGVWDVFVHGACDDAIHSLHRQVCFLTL